MQKKSVVLIPENKYKKKKCVFRIKMNHVYSRITDIKNLYFMIGSEKKNIKSVIFKT